MDELKSCLWKGIEDPVYQQYHDKEWGVPVHVDRTLFEALILDGFQAGLSWITVLKKRENYRKAFDNFSAYTDCIIPEPDILIFFDLSVFDSSCASSDFGFINDLIIVETA